MRELHDPGFLSEGHYLAEEALRRPAQREQIEQRARRREDAPWIAGLVLLGTSILILLAW